jgi:hypothetical protein
MVVQSIIINFNSRYNFIFAKLINSKHNTFSVHKRRLEFDYTGTYYFRNALRKNLDCSDKKILLHVPKFYVTYFFVRGFSGYILI